MELEVKDLSNKLETANSVGKTPARNKSKIDNLSEANFNFMFLILISNTPKRSCSDKASICNHIMKLFSLQIWGSSGYFSPVSKLSPGLVPSNARRPEVDPGNIIERSRNLSLTSPVACQLKPPSPPLPHKKMLESHLFSA
jgi:hypothetical protein